MIAKLKRWYRLKSLEWARKICKREGLTPAEIFKMGNVFYIRDENGTTYVIGGKKK